MIKTDINNGEHQEISDKESSRNGQDLRLPYFYCGSIIMHVMGWTV